MDDTTRQGDAKLVHLVGLAEGQKVYSVARRLHLLRRERDEREERRCEKKIITLVEYYVQSTSK